ncbi:MAG: hypothetical protein JWM37_77 [Candidatus Saccharibacteria bacterium]|nr:hypothetical protein [Candidatus Saccharibacteria bacterium]
MKRFRRLLPLSLLVLAVSFMWAVPASAHSFHSGNNVTLGQDQRIDSTLFTAGTTVTINSEVSGDVFCAGQTVTVSGTVHGDIICAAQTIHITGTVDGDVRLAGQTVTVGGKVGGNATVAGQTFVLEPTGSIAGDASLASSETTVSGPVGRDIAATGSSLVIGSTVGRNVKAQVQNLHLTSAARVSGRVDYTSSSSLTRDAGAVVTGQIVRTEPTQEGNRHEFFGFSILWFLYWLLATLFTAMALVLLFPRLFRTVTDRALPRPWKALLTGFVASLAVPVILIVIGITIIGLPLALLAGLAWLVIVLLSGPVAAFYVGRLVLRNARRPLLVMLVGALILAIAYFIPFIGILVFVAATWIGEGAILLEIFGRTPRPSYQYDEDVAPDTVMKTTKVKPARRV